MGTYKEDDSFKDSATFWINYIDKWKWPVQPYFVAAYDHNNDCW